MSYVDYLRGAHWQRVKLFFKKKNSRCYLCFSKNDLHVHHISYKNIGNELKKDLVVLCSVCHSDLHNGNLNENKTKRANSHKRLAKNIEYYKRKSQGIVLKQGKPRKKRIRFTYEQLQERERLVGLRHVNKIT